ncbi:hypothetical protein Taro_011969 [Colocasia esculenta]|uniref:Rab3GAP catalytic subunit conserved domain-containing protein n=1 Tax=Colocasia esculenta TaxID=4460 RepID=A0A843U2S0_COLES|nr:hypothetical protein [Colocasia esculenta]
MDSSASSSSSPSSSPSLVSKARTVLHSAATRAEKVLTDFRSDPKSDRDRGEGQSQKSGGRSAEEQVVSVGSEVPGRATEEEFKHPKWKHIGLRKKKDWQHSLKNLRIGKKDVDEKFDNTPSDALVAADGLQQMERDSLVAKEMGASGKRDISTPQKTNIVPPASVLKNMAAAIEKGRTFTSVIDVLTADNNSPLMKEKTGLSFSVVKSLMLREKEEKLNTEICGSAEISSAILAEEFSTERKNGSRSKIFPVTYIRGAPPGSFLVKVSEITGSFKSLHKMVSFWHDIVAELRRRWSECKPIPYMPLDENPDLDCCHLHQQMQVINCCVARKLRRTVATESLDSLVSTCSSDSSADFLKLSVSLTTYARIRTGDHVLRLGVSRPSRNLTMLETGEPVYSPVTQEGPVLTEELIKETEEFVLRTGRWGSSSFYKLQGCMDQWSWEQQGVRAGATRVQVAQPTSHSHQLTVGVEMRHSTPISNCFKVSQRERVKEGSL